MGEFTDPARPPGPNGPWPPVTGVDQLFDHGRRWCVNAAGHPSGADEYPDASVHIPHHECRSQSIFVDDLREDLNGRPLELEVYAATPFRFGQPRRPGDPGSRAPRVVLEFYDEAAGPSGLATRFSVSVADASLLVRRLSALLDRIA
jgi:hypothetical protein